MSASLQRLPRTVWALGFVSLFMDFSSETIHALLPVYLTTALGMSVAAVGWIEGIAEATALATRIFSGALLDALGKRKILALAGYSLAALSKPLFPIANGAGLVVAARFLDRFGKGIRGAPRDALIADAVLPAQRGRAYGLRQTLDTIGAVIGPMAAIALMLASGGNFRLVFWFACLPALTSVLVLAMFVHELDMTFQAKIERWTPRSLASFSRAFWMLSFVGAVMTALRVSEAFLVLRAAGTGLDAAFAPLVLVAMSAVYALGAYPAGALADRAPPILLLAGAMMALALSEGVLALASNLQVVFAGIALWGLHMALSQGLLSKLVADHASADQRGTAFGVFNLVSAGGLLAGNAVFGAAWSAYGPAAAYGAAAILSFALAAVIVAAAIVERRGTA